MRGSAATATSRSARRRRPSAPIDALRTGDALFASYRDHATALAVGSPAAAVMAELFGKDTGVAHGRGGSMHLLDVERRFFGGWGIVGAHLPIATGAALAFAHRGEPHAVLCQFGDGAMATGAYHEALNLASVWHLPIVFQVINNQYGMGTRVDQSNAEPELAKQGAGYRMHGERVDGNDVLAVREAASRLLGQARDERRPALLETVTYRYRGHSVADAGKVYRTPEEVAVVARARSDHALRAAPRRARDRDGHRPRGGLGGRRSRGEGRDLAGPGRLVPEPRRPLRPPLRRRGVARAVRTDVDGRAVRRARRGARMADVTYREALRRALDEELERDRDVFLMGEEIGKFEGSYKVTAGLWEKYGADRVRETPISEEGFVGAGIGAAMMGLRPVVEIMTINFILVAMDQVVNHAAKIRYMFGGTVGVPLVIRTPGGAGAQLTAQHSQSLEGWFAGCPGLKVVAPSNPADAYGMLKTAIRDDDPVLFCENLVLYNVTGSVPDNGDFTVPIGLAAIAKEGDDLTIVAHSYTVQRALRVADRLGQDGISVEVVDLRSLRPLDVDTVVESVRKTNRVLVAEEGWSTFGVGAELAARIQRACFDDLDAPVERVGAAEVPMPYSKPLELAALPLESKIEAAARSLLRECGL